MADEIMRNYFRYFAYAVVLAAVASVHADDKVSFFRALNLDNVSTVNSLLGAGFDPNTPDDKGQVPLFLALREESPRVVKALLAHPALKWDQVNTAGETPLMMAALRGNLEAAVALVAKGATVNRPGWTPLHYAASGGHEAVIKLLLDKGAAIEAESPNQTTPLMMASRYGSEASAELLLARGANAKARNVQGLTAADFARLAGRDAFGRKLDELAR